MRHILISASKTPIRVISIKVSFLAILPVDLVITTPCVRELRGLCQWSTL